jgi:hypothetical protein
MPMMPVACRRCGARVLARKSSWNQTSVQWNAEATDRCPERAEAQKMSGHVNRGVFLACSALRESITDAVCDGELPIVDHLADATPQPSTALTRSRPTQSRCP